MRFVDHRTPQQRAAEFLLGMRRRLQVGPLALARFILKRRAAGVEVERLGVGIVVVEHRLTVCADARVKRPMVVFNRAC